MALQEPSRISAKPLCFWGTDSITQLVTGFLLQQAFEQKKCCIKLERFWDTASEIAAVATIIGQKIKSKVPVENLHLLGTLPRCRDPCDGNELQRLR
nr:HDOD domain-containing protein [Pseudoalteromonas xiamenensis]